MLNGNIFLLTDIDPVDLATGKIEVGQEIANDSSQVLGLMDLPELYQFIVEYSLYVAAILLAIAFIGLLFCNKADLVAEKKERIKHICIVVFLISSLITILNIVTNILRSIF